jgi:hypothetical protein
MREKDKIFDEIFEIEGNRLNKRKKKKIEVNIPRWKQLAPLQSEPSNSGLGGSVSNDVCESLRKHNVAPSMTLSNYSDVHLNIS